MERCDIWIYSNVDIINGAITPSAPLPTLTPELTEAMAGVTHARISGLGELESAV